MDWGALIRGAGRWLGSPTLIVIGALWLIPHDYRVGYRPSIFVSLMGDRDALVVRYAETSGVSRGVAEQRLLQLVAHTEPPTRFGWWIERARAMYPARRGWWPLVAWVSVWNTGSLPLRQLTARGWIIRWPHCLTFAAIAIPTAIAWLPRRRPRPGHCRRCGYDLTGTQSGRCPECGQAFRCRD
jgi:hypothetical protein